MSQKHARKRTDGKIKVLLEDLDNAEETLSERIKDYEKRLDDAEAKARQERLEHLSDAEIKVLLECRERDEREGVPRTHLDDLRDLGLLEPDHFFLLNQVEGVPEGEQRLARREAFIALLDTNIPLSPSTRRFLKWELTSKWWPNKRREKRESYRIRAEMMRAELEAAKAEKPAAEAKAEVAKRWGRNSGEALRKALQPNRLNRRPRRWPRG
jgi:hypothetical protein